MMPLDDEPPGYREIADELRDMISSGTYRQGAPMPSRKRLSQEHGVSEQTAQRALDELRAEGLIDVRPGSVPTVRRERERSVVRVQRGSSWTVRMPTPAERTEMRIPPGVPVVVLRHPGGRVEVFPGDRNEFEHR